LVWARFLGKVCFSFFAPFPLFILSAFQFFWLLFFFSFHSVPIGWNAKTFRRVGAVLTCECFVLPSLLVIIIIIIIIVIIIIIQSGVKSFGSWSESRIQSHLFIFSFQLILIEKLFFFWVHFLFLVNHILLWPILDWLVNSVFSVFPDREMGAVDYWFWFVFPEAVFDYADVMLFVYTLDFFLV